MLAVPKRANMALEILKVISSLGVLNTFLVWIILPLPFVGTIAPGDDAAKFLANSGIQPLLSSALFLMVYIVGWALFVSRMEGFRLLRSRLGDNSTDWISKPALTSLRVMAVLLVVSAFLAFWANDFRLIAEPRARAVRPPAGYQQAVRLDLSVDERNSTEIFSFTLQESGRVGVFVLIENVQTDYLDLALQEKGGFSRTLLHGEGYTAGADTVNYEEVLRPGVYTLVLTSARSPGMLTVYLKTSQK
jgi:hypothetical protein